MQSFFSLYYASVGLLFMLALTVIVYIQDNAGWVLGFGVPEGLMLLSTIMFFLGSSLYVEVKPNRSLFTGLAQVIVAGWKNKHLPLPSKNFHGWCYDKGSKLITATDKLRYDKS